MTIVSRHKALVVFGTNRNSNDIEVFYPATGRHQLMPTKGLRPPKDQHNPMAFHPETGQSVVIVDRTLSTKKGGSKPRSVAETWLYNLANDSWSKVTTATLPFGCGMNYNLEYDPTNKVLLLVTGGSRQITTVWAMRLGKRE